ncbi:MAG: hypothetical protein Fur0044_10280 [Anaerolineae bacterium]|nr:hypothetical protein [Anaerolineales bacterium]MCQ3973289.1 hypothetical protein [Anaerolineae bacterium]
MSTTVTVTIPERLYRRLQSVATSTNRAVSDVLIASAEAALLVESADEILPTELSDELAAMRLYSDEALWLATQPTLSPEQQTRLTELTTEQTFRTLANMEQDELKKLLAEYDYSVLRRAQALALLSLRGHVLPDLNQPN